MKYLICLMPCFLLSCLLPGCNEASQASNDELTAHEALSLLGVRAWKFTITEKNYGLEMVLVDSNGNVSSMGGAISQTPVERDTQVLISAKREDKRMSGVLKSQGFSIDYKTGDVFKGGKWAWVGEPILNGDLYYLAADSETINFAGAPFEPNSTKLALRLRRKAE